MHVCRIKVECGFRWSMSHVTQTIGCHIAPYFTHSYRGEPCCVLFLLPFYAHKVIVCTSLYLLCQKRKVLSKSREVHCYIAVLNRWAFEWMLFGWDLELAPTIWHSRIDAALCTNIYQPTLAVRSMVCQPTNNCHSDLYYRCYCSISLHRLMSKNICILKHVHNICM